MKLVKNFVFTLLLVCTLAFNSKAGEMQLPGYVPPPPPPDKAVAEEYPVDSVSGTDTQLLTTETTDDLLYEALVALLSVY